MPLFNTVLSGNVTMCCLRNNVQLGIRAQLRLAKNKCPTKVPLNNPEIHSEPSQTSKMQLFTKIINGIQQKVLSSMFVWVRSSVVIKVPILGTRP